MIKEDQPFSIRARSESFKYAFNGLKIFFRNEHNAWIHLAGTVSVVFLAIMFPVSKMETIALIIVTGLVWVAEIFNTAIEKMMDFISTEKDERIKFIKDVAAGAVLVAAIVAAITGCFVFIPKF